MHYWFGWLIAAVLVFLSLWIVLPAPNLFWLRLAVVAPEVSPFLGCVSAIALLATVLFAYLQRRPLPLALLLALLLAFSFSALPLFGQPLAVRQANRSMASAFSARNSAGNVEVPAEPAASHPPFSWRNFFGGFSQPPVRHRAKIPFASPQGTDLFLDLYQPSTPSSRQPATPAPCPTVVMIYGGGWSRGDSSENAAFGRYLAARGYVVVAIEYRLTPQYQFPAQLEDVKSALVFVRDRADEYEIDRDRMSLVGWSAGAHLAMLAGFQSPDGIRSIVNYYGPVDLAAGYVNPPQPDPLNVQQVLRDFLGGSPDEIPQAYAEASPITYVKDATADSLPPILLIYAARDHVVEAKYGQSLYEQLIESGNTAVWLRVPWAEHAFDKVFNGVGNQLALHFIERFLARTL